MGTLKNIGIDEFPKQGNLLGKELRVCFNYDTTKQVMGRCVREDMEAPGIMLIALNDGRIIKSTECQFQPVESRANSNFYTHPDYIYEDMPLAQAEEESNFIKYSVNYLVEDMLCDESEGRMWLGTLSVAGETCQVQLVVTSIDSHFIDET